MCSKKFNFHHFRQAVALTKNFPKIALLEMSYNDGHLWLSFPGKNPIKITDDDVKVEDERKISMKMYDVRAVSYTHLTLPTIA